MKSILSTTKTTGKWVKKTKLRGSEQYKRCKKPNFSKARIFKESMFCRHITAIIIVQLDLERGAAIDRILHRNNSSIRAIKDLDLLAEILNFS